MGLHPDVKKFLCDQFKKSVNNEIPTEPCEVLVCDLMWLLFKFCPQEDSTAEDLVNFIWNPIERFFIKGGSTYVCIFDMPQYVPVAKAEEHKKRYGSRSSEPMVSTQCSDTELPAPWHSALADRKTRAEIIHYVTEGLSRRFASRSYHFSDHTIFISGVGETVKKIGVEGYVDCPEHVPATFIGEGDIAVAYWVQQFHDSAVIVRVLDTDQIPILMIRAHIANRTAPLFIWLVTPRKQDEIPLHGYSSLPQEGHTLVNVLSLNAEIREVGTRIEEFVYWIICQKTDFVDKVVQNLGVAPTMKALANNRTNAILVTASGAKCDAKRVVQSFERAALQSKRKRAGVRDTGEVEFRRAWWTLLYWSYAWRGRLPAALVPKPSFGFDSQGLRISPTGNLSDFPNYSAPP